MKLILLFLPEKPEQFMTFSGFGGSLLIIFLFGVLRDEFIQTTRFYTC